MKYSGTVLSVSDVNASRKFYENLFGLKLYQDYGINISFTCGLSLQQNFDWLTGLPKEKILKDANNMELCFEEADFDGFLRKLSQYPGVACLGDVVEHGWGPVSYTHLDVYKRQSLQRIKKFRSWRKST